MRTAWILSATLVTVAACGGGSKKADTTGPAPAPTPATEPAPTPDPTPTAKAEGAVTEEECGQLMAHVMDVFGKDLTPDEKAQMEQYKDQMIQQCVAEVTRPQYECAMKAQTKDEMAKCQ